ncbi:MAG: neutral/alkaline non-lysosomal ceramidase N-terminal domain-containing protein [Planctomycetales bacterium]|nr:neutral/alkaline non-lysosomal ceramidase N-terminal domain-containing protein [Planctomycetales bacterium]
MVRSPRPRRIVAALAAALLSGCRARPHRVEPPTSVARLPGAGRLLAGAAEEDITPPPGLPPFGYSAAAKHSSFAGHRVRLRAEAFAFLDAGGGLAAVVVADLGHVSAVLHREVARRVAGTTGLTADRLLLAATHTHSGPAGYAAAAWYNALGSPRIPSGFDPALADFLAGRIARAIERAFGERGAGLSPAVLRVGSVRVPGLTRNRSPEAFLRNPEASPDAPGGRAPPVDETLTLLRLDREDGTPIGGLFHFAGHQTVVSPEADLWHADVFGVATRLLGRDLAGPGGAPVLAFANGAEGDVSFAWRPEPREALAGHSEAMRLGAALAAAARGLWDSTGSAAPVPEPVAVSHAYDEVRLPGAALSDGRSLCETARFGASAMAGAEDGRSSLHPRIVREGMRREGGGCHAPKVVAIPWLQWGLQDLFGLEPPERVPVQVLRVGPLVLVGLPVEPTTQASRRVRAAVTAALETANARARPEDVLVVGLANDYASYCTTPEEYDAQHYEGASMIYGPLEGPFLAEQAARLAAALPPSPAPASPLALEPREFPVGARTRRYPQAEGGAVERRAIPGDDGTRVRVGRDRASFEWRDLDPGRIGVHEGWLVRAEVLRGGGWEPLAVEGLPQDDTGLDVEVRLLRVRGPAADWRATWYFPDRFAPGPAERYRLLVAPRGGLPALASDAFEPAVGTAVPGGESR